MSEAWAIALLGGVLGWIAVELRSIRKALDRFVNKDDCSKAMSGHCDEIRLLWRESRRHGERLAKLEK